MIVISALRKKLIDDEDELSQIKGILKNGTFEDERERSYMEVRCEYYEEWVKEYEEAIKILEKHLK